MTAAFIFLMLLSVLFQPCAALDLCVTALMSSSTPQHLVSAFQSLIEESQACVEVQTVSIESELRLEAGEIVVDVMCNEFLSRKLREEIPIGKQIIDGNEYAISGGEKLFLSKEKELIGLVSLVRWTNATRFCVVIDEKNDNKLYLDRHFSNNEVFYFVLTEEFDHLSLKRTFNKLVKSQGYNVFLILLHRPVAQQFLQVMDELHMGQNSLTILMSLRSVLKDRDDADFPQLANTGPLFLIDSGCEGSIREPDYLLCKLDQALNSQSSESFSVINIVAGGPVPIGHIENDTLTLTSQWTKSVSNFGPSDKPVLTVSMNNGTMNPSGEGGTYENLNYNGALQAFSNVNKDSTLLPYHQLRMFPLTLGLYEFNEEWARKQMENVSRADFGVATLAGMYSGLTIQTIGLLTAMNFTAPMVGACTTSPKLSSPKEFPMFTRVIMSDAYMSVLYVRMIKHYGWTHVAVIHCDDLWCIGLYDLFMIECAKEGITIVNDDTHRLIPARIDRNSTEYDSVFHGVVKSKARVLLTLMYGDALHKTLEALYDLGMRAGDILLLSMDLSMNIFECEDKSLIMKMIELCRGAVQFFPADYVSDYGAKVRNEYIAMHQMEPSLYACFNYDAVMLVAHALDFLIVHGDDYESPDEVNEQLRKTRFRGCTGIVTIAEGTNDRAPIMYVILNAQISADGNISIVKVGTYDPAGLVLFNFTEAIIWPDNTTNVPTDIRVNDIDCPFASKQIVTYIPWVVVTYLSLSLMCVVAVVITIVIWRKWWSQRAVELTVRAEISFDDYILYATIGLEAFQYATMGPDFPIWIRTMAEIGYAAGFNMEIFVTMSREVFWKILSAAFAGVGLWIILSIVVLLRIDYKWKFCCSKIGDLGEKVLPILGNLCFLPIISTLMNVFQCSDAVDDGTPLTFQSTFLKQDCYQRCWTYPHMFYAICSVIALFVYLPAAVFLRPAWQNMQPYLHIHTDSGFLMLKTIYQLFIIVLNKTLKQARQLTHAFVFLLATSLFFGFTLICKPFGYSRPNLWHYISLVCVLWVNILTILDLLINGSSSIAWISIFSSGIGAFIIFGIVIQCLKCPAVLYRSHGPPIENLFRFMLSHNSKYFNVISSTKCSKVISDDNGRLNTIKRQPITGATFPTP